MDTPATMNPEVNPEAAFPRWLIIVRRDQADLYRNLLDSFRDVPRVVVILDRRHGGRRRAETAPSQQAPERRRGDRRAAPSGAEADLWQTAGFRLIHAADDLEVYEAEDHPSR
jgi:hypothetical protein